MKGWDIGVDLRARDNDRHSNTGLNGCSHGMRIKDSNKKREIRNVFEQVSAALNLYIRFLPGRKDRQDRCFE